MSTELFNNRINLNELSRSIEKLKAELSKVIVGQERMIELIIVAILTDGHVLIEGVPGTAKTLTAKLISKAISIDFSRIQFTPDLMPSDILGTSVFNSAKSEFEFKKGPIFSNLILIDEINRSPAKTQSSLFEVMEERQVTIDGNCYQMDKPFMVIATQNPIEHEGTYRLPEAQIDRFLFKIEIDYPTIDEEVQILINNHTLKGTKELDSISVVLTDKEIILYQELIKKIHIEENLIKYITQIVNKTRNHNALFMGASTRASIHLLNASKAYAAIKGRDFITPEDIQILTEAVLNHRVFLTPEKELEGIRTRDVIKDIIKMIEIPR